MTNMKTASGREKKRNYKREVRDFPCFCFPFPSLSYLTFSIHSFCFCFFIFAAFLSPIFCFLFSPNCLIFIFSNPFGLSVLLSPLTLLSFPFLFRPLSYITLPTSLPNPPLLSLSMPPILLFPVISFPLSSPISYLSFALCD